ncbi:flavin reductase family protein [Camelimonas abortus]|uniref:Flavin reductase family protein n=1 Tax=Camelimonas abortus TaxID=1017184 RepID=A0ABV7LDW7_9HYPH
MTQQHPMAGGPDHAGAPETRRFDFAAMDGAARYRLLASTIMPRPIAWVTTCAPDGTVNAAPYSFFNFFGADRPVLAIGALARPGREKDTAANIRATGEFVVNLVSFALAEAMNATCVEAPPEVDELALAGLAAAPSHAVAPPRIAASPAAFECRVMRLLDTGPGQLLVVGEILHAHYAERVLRGPPERPRVAAAALDLVGRMHGASAYVRTRDVFHLERPVWPAPAGAAQAASPDAGGGAQTAAAPGR